MARGVSHSAAITAYVGIRIGLNIHDIICAIRFMYDICYILNIVDGYFINIHRVLKLADVNFKVVLNASYFTSQACYRISEPFPVLGHGAPRNVVSQLGKIAAYCFIAERVFFIFMLNSLAQGG